MRCSEICHHTAPKHKRPQPVPACVKVSSKRTKHGYQTTAERLRRRRRVYFPQKLQGWIYLSYEGIGTVNELLWKNQPSRFWWQLTHGSVSKHALGFLLHLVPSLFHTSHTLYIYIFYMYTDRQTDTHTHTHTHVYIIHTHYIYIYRPIYIHVLYIHIRVCVCECVCVQLCIHITYINMWLCVCIYIYIYIYICMHVRIYAS